jgi:hypothetical protein
MMLQTTSIIFLFPFIHLCVWSACFTVTVYKLYTSARCAKVLSQKRAYVCFRKSSLWTSLYLCLLQLVLLESTDTFNVSLHPCTNRWVLSTLHRCLASPFTSYNLSVHLSVFYIRVVKCAELIWQVLPLISPLL